MSSPVKCENCGKIIAEVVNGNFKQIDPDWGMSEDERELCGECYKKEKIMEHPTKEEALKELAEIFWNNDENWENLNHFIYNGLDDLAELNPTDYPLYYAAIAVDKLENYLETFYGFAEEAKWTRNFLVCKDCYDYISSEDANMVADVFTHYYGEEEGDIRFLDVSNCVENIEKDGKFWDEVPELLQEFSRNPCACCKSHLHGERFFMLFEKNRGNCE